MGKRWVALGLFVMLFSVSAWRWPFQHLPLTAVGGPALWYLTVNTDGKRVIDPVNALAGTAIRGEAVGPPVNKGYCTLPRLTRSSTLLGGNVALTRCDRKAK